MLPFTSVNLWNSIDLILSAAGRGGARRTAFFDPRRVTKGRGELLFCPRRGAEDTGGVSGFLCVTYGPAALCSRKSLF